MISFRTASGIRMDLGNPKPEDIRIEDIARGLSHCCRFAGQVPKYYSVAQHSILVSSLVDEDLRLPALLHDASEAYLGDLSRNLKHHDALAGYRHLEENLQCVIVDTLHAGVPWSDYLKIKVADNAAAIFEHVTLREGHELSNDVINRLLKENFVRDDFEALSPYIRRLPWRTQGLPTTDPFDPWLPWSASEAEDRFMALFHELHG